MPFVITCGEITRMHADAVVIAADSAPDGRGAGEARIAGGSMLPARYVIQTAGPVWRGGRAGEQAQLASCYRSALALAAAHGCKTAAFPLISAGASGYPPSAALAVARRAIAGFLQDHDMTVYLVLSGRSPLLLDSSLYRDIRGRLERLEAESASSFPPDSAIGAPPSPAPARKSRRPLFPRAQKPVEAADAAFPLPAQQAEPEMPVFGGAAPAASAEPDWDRLLRQTDEGFSQMLLRLIDEKGLTDVQCYRRANVDRKLFSKIRSNPAYRPGKPLVCAFIFALELSGAEADALLRSAGYALSRSSRFDIVVEYFLTHRPCSVFEINEVLFQFDLPLLGSAMS